MPTVHPSAVIDDAATIADDVHIGPQCVVTGPVVLEAGVRLIATVHVQGPATIGAGCVLYPGACVGYEPQDFKFAPGSPTAGVRLGAGTLLREHCTVHAASNEHTPTTIGEGCMLMACSHVAHDCQIGNKVVLVNYAGLSGHNEVGDGVIVSGLSGTHQHVRLGKLCFFTGCVQVGLDVPPFCVVTERQRLGMINRVGMRRAGYSRDAITKVNEAFRTAIAPCLPKDEMLEVLDRLGADEPACAEMADFVRGTKRGIVPGPARPPRMIASWLRHRTRGDALHIGDDLEL